MIITTQPITAADIDEMNAWLGASDLDPFMNGWTPRCVREGHWPSALCRWDFILLDQTRVGTIWIERSSSESTTADLGVLIAAPEHRRRGIGTQVVCDAERAAKEDWGTQVVQLRVRASNQAATACYQRIGYTVNERTVKSQGETSYEVLHMAHALS